MNPPSVVLVMQETDHVMYSRKTDEDLSCGLRVAFKIFGGKWNLCIIDAIRQGITRPAEIHKWISSPPRRVIEIQLAELLFFGVVERQAEDTYPRKTEYRLTALGESILPLLDQLDKWGTEHKYFVMEKQNSLVQA